MSSARMCVGVFRIILDFSFCVWGVLLVGINWNRFFFFFFVCHEEYIVTTFCCVLGCLLFYLKSYFQRGVLRVCGVCMYVFVLCLRILDFVSVLQLL